MLKLDNHLIIIAAKLIINYKIVLSIGITFPLSSIIEIGKLEKKLENKETEMYFVSLLIFEKYFIGIINNFILSLNC